MVENIEGILILEKLSVYNGPLTPKEIKDEVISKIDYGIDLSQKSKYVKH